MNANFRSTQLQNILLIKPRNGLYKNSKFHGSGNRWVKMKDVYGNDFITNQNMELLEVTDDELEKFGCNKGDLLFGRTSLTLEGIGDCAIIGDITDRPIFESNLFRLRLDPKKGNPYFYYYFFKSKLGKQYIQSIAKQTAASSITAQNLISLHVPCPGLHEQKRIACIFSSLDYKIQLNRRINQTLEEMAQAIFKSWFVDFEPVRAKIEARANGRDPERAAMSAISGKTEAELKNLPLDQLIQLAATAALFPDELVDSELGMIPKGWEVSSFDSLANNIRAGVLPSNEPPETPYVGLEHIEKKHLHLADWGRAKDVDSNKSKFFAGDILFGKLRPYFHKVCFVPFEGIASTDILVIRAKQDDWRGYVQFQLFDEKFVEYANVRSTGTRMPRANWKDMAQYPLVKPPKELASTYNQFVEKFNELAATKVHESIFLTQLRDTLLPKLLSGEISVNRAQATIEEAV